MSGPLDQSYENTTNRQRYDGGWLKNQKVPSIREVNPHEAQDGLSDDPSDPRVDGMNPGPGGGGGPVARPY